MVGPFKNFITSLGIRWEYVHASLLSYPRNHSLILFHAHFLITLTCLKRSFFNLLLLNVPYRLAWIDIHNLISSILVLHIDTVQEVIIRNIAEPSNFSARSDIVDLKARFHFNFKNALNLTPASVSEKV